MTRTIGRLLLMVAILIMQCPLSDVLAQGTNQAPMSGITIAGNVYGGGNAGETGGSTHVTVRAGELNNVYAGARMADVKGNAFVHVDGEHASDDILITSVYGGNDIAGTIGDPNKRTAIPDELTEISTKSGKNAIDNTWNAFVRTSRSSKVVEGKTVEDKAIIIGSLFGGGNGDYFYRNEGDSHEIYLSESDYKAGGAPIASNTTGFSQPELGKTYLEILGGCVAHVYGGGNNATVKDNTTICINNTSDVLDKVAVAWAKKNGKPEQEVLAYLMTKVKLSTFQSNLTSYSFNFARVFGGNNKAEMAIRPIWDLKNGVIRDLYSGGNQGEMTSPEGLLLNIEKDSRIVVDNLYGGCRMADVCPKVDGVYTETTKTFEGYNFPVGYSARVVIRGGDVNNVYGGNDISGKVYGGNAVGISASIRGDVYGGGNGSYAYTDNPILGQQGLFKDFYYDKGSNSVEALNAVRPNAEQVSIHVSGTEDKPTVIHGGIYCGGNSATIMSSMENPTVQLKIGSYVIADSVFLGNNGANLVKKDVLKYYAGNVDADGNVVTSGGTDYSSLDLTNETTFGTYMDAATMRLKPSVTFDKEANGDGVDYKEYTSYFGSFFCGGNVGSMRIPGKVSLNFDKPFYIYNKVVGGCNNANIPVIKDNNVALNHEYFGGFIGEPEANTRNKLEINFAGLKIKPMRWKFNADGSYALDNKGNHQLEWNTFIGDDEDDDREPLTDTDGDGYGNATTRDIARRLKGGNIYGGCYNSGHINGNVIININDTLVERDKIFDVTIGEGDILYENVEGGIYNIKERNSGVLLSEQGMDVLGSALNVFGGGFGKASEIWGSTTINLNKGYTFQIFGGGEAGAIGHEKDSNGNYIADEKYSTYINLNGDKRYPGVPKGAAGDVDGMAECEFIYGGAFEGLIAGSTHINLNNGRIFNTFAGSCNADILGHTETYVGQNGFPWVRDHLYGGNDLGGSILGEADFLGRIRDEVKGMVADDYKEQVKKAAAYMEYTQGRVRNLLGGCFGDYDYTEPDYQVGEGKPVANKPYLHNAFVNFRPNENPDNAVEKIFGGGEGYPGDRDGDKSQDHSYVLIDIPEGLTNFANTEVFGAGAYNGLGMRLTREQTFAEDFDLDEASGIIDLMRGRVSAAYGGSYEEGITRRTVVNVPEKSTIKINSIFGGAYGMQILPPCDVYEANVNYRSGNARVNGAIYGGNNNVRRTLYSKVNISAPVNKENGYSGYVYGAGRGQYTWSEYTEVNLEKGAKVWEVYGGGELGNVLNAESVQKYLQLYSSQPAAMVANEDPDYWGNKDKWVNEVVGGTLKEEFRDEWKKAWMAAWTIGDYYKPVGEFTRYVGNTYTNLNNPLVRKAELDDRSSKTYKYNTNVLIHEGATVSNYGYGGGYGSTTIPLTGGVYGSTYIALLGGTVGKDIYAAGTTGSVCDIFGAGAPADNNPMGFTATANAYIQGGMLRNVYGGGWRGSVGYHNGDISEVANNATDLDGETHVVIGNLKGSSFVNGIPAIQRNVYGGGEGGGIFGTAYVTVNNGRIGYRYKNVSGTRGADDYQYVEELDDVKAGDNLLDRSGNVFGGGYVANSYVDFSDIKMYGGIVRGGLYGGGEVGPIGRGTVKDGAAAPEGTFINGKAKIYKPGGTKITLYKGHVMRDVFGGGRGFDNWGGEGYMTDEEKLTMDLSSKGYVFGKTDVQILGGEVGTTAGVADGYGNVFGGGNVGYVYSGTGKKPAAASGNKDPKFYYDGDYLTEDCRVLVTPYCQAKSAVTIDGKTYQAGEYVPSSELDKLKNKSSDARWSQLDDDGIIIRNAVFAGGNVTIGDNEVYANEKTVLGNVSANVVDIFNRDLITVGTEHVGGIYGDGCLTLVDGYRELNISNYGTDYYNMLETITLDEYLSLTDRERAYFALEYQCETAFEMETSAGRKSYTVGQRITEELYNDMPEQYKSNWKLYGFCSIYAGRLMNTIQRADFCGIFGSRLVMQGAKDRVPSVADKTDYTVNRVGEVSLNQVKSISGEKDDDGNTLTHGNYFGIYSIVNYMGGLTSDVDFYNTVRTTDNTNSSYDADGKTFYEWKEAFPKERKRNNGKVANSVALASGVYLELTTEKGTPENKDWGYITGVAQLELINVKTGLGGGYVYAKNEHGTRTLSGNDHTILSPYNLATAAHAKAVTNKLYKYSPTTLKEINTSGNFVHNVKQIIDECYPTINAYQGENAAPAHYWFIRGTSYVYDQYITAYTGVANAYSKTQKIPLNITAASHGKMKLEDVKENLYAYYYSTEANEKDRTPLQNTDENAATYSVLVNNDVTYHLNDSISYWDWLQLSEVDQRHFVADTYLTIAECKIGNTTYPENTVLLPADYEKLKASAPKKVIDGETVPSVYHVAKEEDVDFDFVFRRSNNLSHELGYVVTYAVDNPSAWDTQDPNCTYSPNRSGVYGQHFYGEGEIIDKSTHDDYESMGSKKPTEDQAQMAEAYVTKEDVTFTDGTKTYNFIAGTPLCKEEFSSGAWTSISSKVERALVCTGTVEFEGEYASKSMLYGEVLTTARYNEVVNAYKNNFCVSEADAKKEIDKMTSSAYICYREGYYGGGYFEAGQKYTALKGWSSLTPDDRQHFSFNYDALNLLIDPEFSGNMALYDNNKSPFLYSSPQPIDYEAVYNGSKPLTFSVNNVSHTVNKNDIIARDLYEAVPNEQYHYSPVKVDNTMVYVVNTAFARGDTPYSVGQVITSEAYSYLTSNQQQNVTALTFNLSDIGHTYYYCRESYQISGDNNGHAVTDTRNNNTIRKGATVAQGVVITEDNYDQLTNLQKDFTIQGNAPEELTTLYVASQSDVYDLQKDRILTVIYSYDYTESDESGTHIEPVSERHIVNIHIHFESGVPEIGNLHSPAVSLPGDYVGLYQPTVKPGAYEIMGGGWEIFQNEEDAERHRNGKEFDNKTPVYWYQDGQYLAYYAKTYLGKTYSNAVPFNVANYHDLKAVMADTENHLYIDHPDVKRASKIYINDYSDDDKSGLDLLKDIYNLSAGETLTGHSALNNRVKGMQNLEVFFHADAAPKAYANNWTPIASGDGQCYNGNIHGEGYHVDGLTSSLIGHLCGHVYNLGVSGSFTSAGLADSGDGYVENCWVMTSGKPDNSVYAVFGNPTDAVSTTKQMENCYYYAAGGDYKTTGATHGQARLMTEQQFYNGEVAYNLNGFYLKERYNRQASANDKIDTYGYVEGRYSNDDIDFLYASGEIPVEDDVRLKTDAEGNYYYEPLWPDDYLFFGQMLTGGYDFVGTGIPEYTPSHLNKTGQCNTLENVPTSNRVYRTPAYFGSKQMGLYHFNPYAVLAAKTADGKHDLYPGMTAVDFTGYNDKGYSKGLADGIFFAPICDADITLAGVANADETRNLLVYSPQPQADTDTDTGTNADTNKDTDTGTVLATYFTEPEMVEKDDDATTGMKAVYRAVDALSAGDIGSIHGHIVYRDGEVFSALTDHILVDRQDFNCPMSYTFGKENRMWYQRQPDNYVDAKEGWEAISLPFSAELVTTPDKGEISHFYEGSTTGHEYWLREFKGGAVDTTDPTTYIADFLKPEAGTEKKYYTNTFLWDYYYSYDNYWDQNNDEYQKTYYQEEHVYSGYPYNGVATPYIIGFPGSRYYEFDLSGTFKPNYTHSSIDALEMQPIIFASEPGIKIAVSDDELKPVTAKGYRYQFIPSYSNKKLTSKAGYVLAADGGSFDRNAEEVVVEAFRPYFIAANGTRGGDVERIIFGGDNSNLHPNEDLSKKEGAGTLNIYAKKGYVVVESSLTYTEDVRIVTAAGITVAAFSVKPGDTVEVRADFSGMYIAYTLDGKYMKKVAVRK